MKVFTLQNIRGEKKKSIQLGFGSYRDLGQPIRRPELLVFRSRCLPFQFSVRQKCCAKHLRLGFELNFLYLICFLDNQEHMKNS